MLEFHVPKIPAYFSERVVLFLYPYSFLIHSIQETSIQEGVIMEIFSCLFDTFPANLIVFAIYNIHKELYVKNS